MNKLKEQFELVFRDLLAAGHVRLQTYRDHPESFGNEIIVFDYQGVAAQLVKDRGSVECDIYVDLQRKRRVPLHLAMSRYNSVTVSDNPILTIRRFFEANHVELAKDISARAAGGTPTRFEGITFEDNLDEVVQRIRTSINKRKI